MHTVLPSPSAQSGVPYLRKRSRSPWFRLPAPSAVSPPWGPHSAKAVWFSPPLCQSSVVLSPFSAKATWSSLPGMAAAPWFKSQRQSSSAAPFLTPPTVSYTCQHSHILPALLGCHSKSGQVWPHGMEPVISKLSRRPCNQGELLPSPILGGSHSHLPGSKQGHSYLTHP